MLEQLDLPHGNAVHFVKIVQVLPAHHPALQAHHQVEWLLQVHLVLLQVRPAEEQIEYCKPGFKPVHAWP